MGIQNGTWAKSVVRSVAVVPPVPRPLLQKPDGQPAMSAENVKCVAMESAQVARDAGDWDTNAATRLSRDRTLQDQRFLKR